LLLGRSFFFVWELFDADFAAGWAGVWDWLWKFETMENRYAYSWGVPCFLDYFKVVVGFAGGGSIRILWFFVFI
jgi:hypothetical protein